MWTGSFTQNLVEQRYITSFGMLHRLSINGIRAIYRLELLGESGPWDSQVHSYIYVVHVNLLTVANHRSRIRQANLEWPTSRCLNISIKMSPPTGQFTNTYDANAT